MNPSIETVVKDNYLISPEKSFSIGLREFLFLALILFFGFCGFTFCVNTIYTKNVTPDINEITVHSKDYTFSNRKESSIYQSYMIN